MWVARSKVDICQLLQDYYICFCAIINWNQDKVWLCHQYRTVRIAQKSLANLERLAGPNASDQLVLCRLGLGTEAAQQRLGCNIRIAPTSPILTFCQMS